METCNKSIYLIKMTVKPAGSLTASMKKDHRNKKKQKRKRNHVRFN